MAQRTILNMSFLLCAFLLVLALSPACARADEIPDTNDRSSGITGSILFKEGYNDNILDYSQDDLHLFSDKLRPGKFSISREYDYITTVRAKCIVSREFFDANPTAVRFRLNYANYAANNISDYYWWDVELRQTFLKKNYFAAGFSQYPKYYLRNLTYRDLTLRPREWLKTAEAKLERKQYSFDLQRSFTSKLIASIGYQYGATVYNSALSERNNTTHRATIEAAWRAFTPVKISCGYAFSYSRADGRAMSDSVTDISYRSHGIKLGTDVFFRSLIALPFILRTDFTFEYQEYLSGKFYDKADVRYRYGDRYHFGRIDRFYKISNELLYRLFSDLEVFVEHSWEQTLSNLEQGGDAGSYQTHQLEGGIEFTF